MSCFEIGISKGEVIHINENSCHTKGPSCMELGGDGATYISVGKDSCIGESACNGVGYDADVVTIGTSTCLGKKACEYTGSKSNMPSVSFGDGACQTEESCYWCDQNGGWRNGDTLHIADGQQTCTTSSPTMSQSPSSSPTTHTPTLSPTVGPTTTPTAAPTSRPSSSPSAYPTSTPTSSPTQNMDEYCWSLEKTVCRADTQCQWQRSNGGCMSISSEGFVSKCYNKHKDNTCNREVTCLWNDETEICEDNPALITTRRRA